MLIKGSPEKKVEYGGWKPIDGLALWPVNSGYPAPVAARRLGRLVSSENETKSSRTIDSVNPKVRKSKFI